MSDYLKVLAITVLGGLLAGLVVTHFSSSVVNQYTTQAIGSPVGTTFNTAKVAAIDWTLSAGATSTSILNSDSSNRWIDETFYSCTGVGTSGASNGASGGLAKLTIKAATSSAALIEPTTNVNLIMVNDIATTTGPLAYMASTTVVGLPSRQWASGSYLNFEANATNTAACTVGAYYHGS